jgi:hypothetical protein
MKSNGTFATIKKKKTKGISLCLEMELWDRDELPSIINEYAQPAVSSLIIWITFMLKCKFDI